MPTDFSLSLSLLPSLFPVFFSLLVCSRQLSEFEKNNSKKSRVHEKFEIYFKFRV